MAQHDVVVIGGAAMGAATALHLRRLAPDLDVVVIEREPGYEHCSTLRSDGNLRVQFNLEENVRMSQYTFDLLPTFADAMGEGDFRPDPAPRYQGNLFLSDEEGLEAAHSGMDLQRSLGCEVEWLDADEIAARWPAYRCEEVVGGVFGPRDGSVDPSAVLQGLRRTAERLGATFRDGDVVEILTTDGRASGVLLASGERVDAGAVVLCTGAWSAPLAATAGVTLPITPVMRTVHIVDSPLDVADLPSVFLPSGLYVLPELTGTTQMAWSTDEDEVGFDFTYRRGTFDETLWPELLRVLPAWNRLKVTGGWRGLYAMNTLDHNAILGEWPTVPGLHVAAGFSGHGFQHTPAMGRYIAERLTGAPVTLDLSRLGPERILAGRPVREHAGRII